MSSKSTKRRNLEAAKSPSKSAKANQASTRGKGTLKETAAAYRLALKTVSRTASKRATKVVAKHSITAAGGSTNLPSAMDIISVPGLCGKGLVAVGGRRELELRSLLKMTRPVFSRLVGVSERTIAEVESGKDVAKKLVRPYNEIYRLWESLSEVIESDYIGEWLQAPNSAFNDLKPIEVIERGNINRLWGMVFELQTGMPL